MREARDRSDPGARTTSSTGVFQHPARSSPDDVYFRRLLIGLLILLCGLSACRKREPAGEEQEPSTAPPAGVKILYPAAPGSFVKTVEKVRSAVVHLRLTEAVQGGPYDEFPSSGPGDSTPVGNVLEQLRRSLGSGVLVDSAGTILTNAHLIRPQQEIWAVLEGGIERQAQLIGQDSKSDLAVLKIETRADDRFVPARLGDSDQLQVGEWVLALGRPFPDGGPVASAGVLMATEQRLFASTQAGYWAFLRTDAVITASNSGGPLVNALGEVVGINTTLNMEDRRASFAIPMTLARKILPMLQREGKVVRAWFGMYIDQVTETIAQQVGLDPVRGAYITTVLANGPAARAGLQTGDIILSFDGKVIENARELPWWGSLLGVDRQVSVTVWREGNSRSFTVTTEKMPE